jgi:hypothetical protein
MDETYSTEFMQAIKKIIHQSDSKIICSCFAGSEPEEVIQEILLPYPPEQDVNQLIHRGKIKTEDDSPLPDELWNLIVQDFIDESGYEKQPFMIFQNPEEGGNQADFFLVKFNCDGRLIHKDPPPQKTKAVLQRIKERYETPQLIISSELENE